MTFEVGLPTLSNMFRMSAGDGAEGRSRRALWLLGIGATGFGIWGFFQLVPSHITHCGFDANGAYAEVRVSGLANPQEVWVDFYLDGTLFAYEGSADVRAPTFGLARTVLRTSFPGQDVAQVSGRTVYVDAMPRGQVKFVTRKFAESHPDRTRTEVVPGPGHTLTCRFDDTDPD
jgi:hypothetical protein